MNNKNGAARIVGNSEILRIFVALEAFESGFTALNLLRAIFIVASVRNIILVSAPPSPVLNGRAKYSRRLLTVGQAGTFVFLLC